MRSLITATLLAAAALVVPSSAAAAASSGGAVGIATQRQPPKPLGPNEDPFKVLVQGGPVKEPTNLESLARSATAAAMTAHAASSVAMTATAEANARRAAEDAEEAAVSAEDANLDARRAGAQLSEALSRQERGRVMAAQSAMAATAAYRSAQAYVQNLDKMAEQAVDATGFEEKLAPLYKDLQDWKMAVLHDPVKEGRRAGVEAARPYEQQLLKIETKVGADQQRATWLSDQARSLRADGSQLANIAVEKQAAGDLLGARGDMMKAHEMVSQASQTEQIGRDLQKKAAEQNEQVPLYVFAAQNAAQEAVHRYAPDLFARPPLGRGPFLRPPPVGDAAEVASGG